MNSPLLSRLRRARWVHGLQLLVFTCWVANPFPGALSYWTDTNGDRVKEWAEDPPQGDSWWDADSDSDNLTNAQEALFGSDPYRIDADFDGLTDLVERDYADLTAPLDPWNWDSDGDGVSDHDEYYQYIQGHTPVVNYHNLGGVFHSYYDADGDGQHNQDDSDPANMDRDGDAILNWNDSYPDDANNGYVPPTTDPGVWIGGMWYPTGTSDSDNDGTPDPSDPYPWGSFWYNGIEYGGTWSDRDGDGVPDAVDPFPDGSHWYNGIERSGPWVDQDGDNVPDSSDSWPTIAGSYSFNGSEYPGAWNDQDGDNTPDPADPSPNGSYWWNGTEYLGPWVDQDGDGTPDTFDFTPNGGSSYWYNGTQYAGNWSDADGDGVPDPADATPNGGYWYNGTEYAGVWSDQDIDSIPDPADATPNGSYWYNGTEYAGVWADSDGDSIPDAQDGWPTDSWNGEPHYGYNGSEYAGTWTDRDGDNVPDPADSWPDDFENGLDSDGDGLSNYAERTEHGTDPGKVDSDDDFLTDYEELYAFHTSPLLPISDAAGGQTLLDGYVHRGADSDADGLPNRLEQHYAALGYLLDPANAADAAGDLDGDGYTNAQAYHFGWSLIANLSQYDYDGDRIPDAIEDSWSAVHPGVLDKTLFADAVADFDGDGVMNFEEITLGLDPAHASSARADGFTDAQVLSRHLKQQVTAGSQAEQILRSTWDNSVSYLLFYNYDDGLLTGHPEWQEEADTDANGLPDGWEAFLADYLPPVTRMAENDCDGDGMPDEWEHRHHFNLRVWQDSGNDADGDTLLNYSEFLLGTHPRIADSDADGYADDMEVNAGSDPNSNSSNPAGQPLLLHVVSGDAQGARAGQSLPAPLVVQASRGALPWPGVVVTFSAAAGSFGSSSVTTNAEGLASTGYTMAGSAHFGDNIALIATAGEAETVLHATVLMMDTDGDGLADEWEMQMFGNLASDPADDPDNDGLSNLEEQQAGTQPASADSDGDGITDTSELQQGTDAKNAGSRPAFESVKVVGKGGPGERKSKELTLTLPEGEQTYLVVVAAQSEEYPGYTGTQSEFDDVVDWRITPAGGAVIEGEKHVNELHEQWEESVAKGGSFLGLSPAAVVVTKAIQGRAGQTTSVQIELGAKNVSDGVLPTTLAAALLPIEFEVTKWEPVITQPLDPYTTAWGNRNPPENQIDDEAFVGRQPDGNDTFLIKTEVKLKQSAIPPSVLSQVANQWKIGILQNIYAEGVPDTKIYVGPGGATEIERLTPVPSMDKPPGGDFPRQDFTTGTETISLEYSDTPESSLIYGVPLYKRFVQAPFPPGTPIEQRPPILPRTDVSLAKLKRNTTFVTWVYAEHKPSQTRHFLKWIRWQTAWDVDFDGSNHAPPHITKNTYVFRKIDEGEGTGPISPPSFQQFQRTPEVIPAN